MDTLHADPDQPLISFAGDLVALGPHRRALLPLYVKWINDFAVTRTYGTHFRTVTADARLEWYERFSKGGPDYADFVIYERSTMRAIGYTSLEDIDLRNRTARFGILIGEQECWGKGYGTETTRLMLDYAFTALGLHNIMLQVFSFNERGIGAYTRAGFRLIGRRREAHRLGGQAYDVLLMDCLASEFQSPVLHQLLPT